LPCPKKREEKEKRKYKKKKKKKKEKKRTPETKKKKKKKKETQKFTQNFVFPKPSRLRPLTMELFPCCPVYKYNLSFFGIVCVFSFESG
jgi:hypothetical protein